MPNRYRAMVLSAHLFAIAAALAPLAQVWLDQAPATVLLKLPLDLLAALLIARRRWRFAAALWFGVSGLMALLQGVIYAAESAGAPSQLFLAVVSAGAAVSALWPRLVARSESDRLSPLSLQWALLATLLVSTADAVVLRWSPVVAADAGGGMRAASLQILATGAASLALFVALAVGSRGGFLRWPVQLIGVLAAAGIAGIPNRGLDFPFGGADLVSVELALRALGALTFALGFDWLRSAPTPLGRLARTTALLAGVAVLPGLIAAPHQTLVPAALALALLRPLAFGLAMALAPRVAGKLRRGIFLRRPLGLPPARLAWLPILAAGVAVATLMIYGRFYDYRHEQAAWIAGIAAAAAGLALLFRGGTVRALLALAVCAPAGIAIVTSLERQVLDSPPMRAVSVLALLGVALFAKTISSPAAARHFVRRRRISLLPWPRASGALAALSLAGTTAVLAAACAEDPTRAGILLSRLEGPVPLGTALFVPRVTAPGCDEDRAAHVGSTVAVDPLGRGTWIVDEERDEVALIGDGEPRRFAVGAWPEQLVVDRTGRVFVSCRGVGRVQVIHPDLSVTSIEVGPEPRPLALDEKHDRLYVGLMTPRELVAIDTNSFAVVHRRAIAIEPRSIAAVPRGVAVLPGLGRAVLFVGKDLSGASEVPLDGAGKSAWHGQALVPWGENLIAVHAAVDTGLARPVSTGGYGGSVQEPVEMMVTILNARSQSIYPAQLGERRKVPAAEITGAAVSGRQLLLASRGTDWIVSCTLDGAQLRGCTPQGVAAGDGGERGVGLTGMAIAPDGSLRTLAAFSRELVSFESNLAERGRSAIGAGRLSGELAVGRRLFHQAKNPAIAGATLACATCHPDGREDGLVWRLKGSRRQTPMLAGRLHDTGPFNWQGTAETLPANIHETVERLGGTGLDPAQTKALARFIATGLRAPVRPVASSATLVARGQRIFNDARVGCAQCHDPGGAFTDGARHDVESMSQKELEEMRSAHTEGIAQDFDTPSLKFAGLTAPYFHDGSAPTLEAVIDRNADRMGHTKGLSREERRALVAYLETL